MLISLIVPCYNEQDALPLFYQEASRVAEEMGRSHGAEFEFVFIDDGSKDDTLSIMRALHGQDAGCATSPSAAISARRRASGPG